MTDKTLPFTREQIERIVKEYPTPFHIYDEKGMRANARRLVKAFSWAPGFKEYYAVKACPNPFIMKVLKQEGFGSDCSSLAELVLSERTGITGENIFFSSNDTPAAEYRKARELGAIINLDDITHIPFLEKEAGLPEVISFRYNPGPLRGGNHIIGHPEEAKYGFTRPQLFEGYRILKEKGVTRFGLHTMVASNELDPDYFVDTADMLFNLVAEIHLEVGIRFEFVNLGGGFGIPYRPEQNAINLEYVSDKIHERYDQIIVPAGLHPLKIFMESGRMITGPYGFLVARA
ncbi:MAG TPA: diaminopimelate decarboxylase, partial [Spirochaetota bacterium]|nr:diaminopimelate decarboxylase [Spirochaetota bacterium]